MKAIFQEHASSIYLEKLKVKSKNVLVVENNLDDLESMKTLFRGLPYNCIYCTSADEAFSILGKVKIDIVIASLHLSGIDGIQFIRIVNWLNPTCVRILLKNFNQRHCYRELMSVGKVHSFVSKPWNDDFFMKSVISACQFSDKQAEIQKKSNGLNDKDSCISLHSNFNQKVANRLL